MTVLCHDALGGIRIHLRAVGVLAGVVGVAVEEEDAVGVLLDGAGVTQVGQLGAVAGVIALLVMLMNMLMFHVIPSLLIRLSSYVSFLEFLFFFQLS